MTKENIDRYNALVGAEDELHGEILKDAFYGFVLAGLLTFAGVAWNNIILYILAGGAGWVYGIRLVGLAVAWGSLRARRYVIAHSDENED